MLETGGIVFKKRRKEAFVIIANCHNNQNLNYPMEMVGNAIENVVEPTLMVGIIA